jgi:unsaturated chondroitin disaccharide hydrolase
MVRHWVAFSVLGLVAGTWACSDDTQGGGGSSGSGGSIAAGSGGTAGSSGAPPAGGTGAQPSTGGTGGQPPAGGTGGASAAGGTGGDAQGGTGGDAQGGTGGDVQGGTGGDAQGGTGGDPVGGAGGAAGAPPTVDVTFCVDALDAAALQYDGFRNAYTDPSQIPRSADASSTRLVGAGDWTSGFVAGSMWLLYEHTQDESWRTTAEAWTAALENQKYDTGTHDVGFQVNCSFGNGYRLTGNAAYVEVLTTAASSLSTRFSQTVGAIECWGDPYWNFPTIIDSMMNTELLFVATELGGDTAYYDRAVTHADTLIANHFRADGSSYHLVEFDAATGAVLRKVTVQGLADESAWARGQSWGLYGYTMAHRKTGEARFLQQAQTIAQFLINHPDLPEDLVPYHDYDAVDLGADPLLRDASAAALMASALLELSGFVGGAEGETYRDHALGILRSLSGPDYAAATGTNHHFLLMHSVGHYGVSEEDVAINYADYYYLEALLRCSGLNG